MRVCIIIVSIILGLIFCSTYVESRANSQHLQSSKSNPISEASDENDDSSSKEFEKFRRATVSVLLDSDSEETIDQLLMRAKLLAYVDKLKAKEAKKKLKADKKTAKTQALLAAYLAANPTTTTTTTIPTTTTTKTTTTTSTAAPNPVTTPEISSESDEDSKENSSESSTETSDEGSTTETSNEGSTTEINKAVRSTFNVTVSDSAETTDDLLMRAKITAYIEKLKAAEAKKKMKAKLKAEKDKAFFSMFLAAGTVATPAPVVDATSVAADSVPDSAPAKRAVATDSVATLLAEAKLNAYIAKLQAKQEKAKLKADKKAAKAKMFAAYLASAASPPALGTPAATGVLPAPAPVVPFPGALGLWNKSMFLSGLFTSMAQANAAAAAAATAAAATTPQPIPAVVQPEPIESAPVSDETEEPVTELSDISKRSAYPQAQQYESVEESEESTEDTEEPEQPEKILSHYTKQQYSGYKPARPITDRDQQILDFWKKYNKGDGGDMNPNGRTDIGNRHKPGATNDFKTGKAGSPNGVGYAESPVSQAGCSGNHIHSCSGMTVYINKSEDELSTETSSEIVPVKEEETPKKHHGHHHKGKHSKRSLLKPLGPKKTTTTTKIQTEKVDAVDSAILSGM